MVYQCLFGLLAYSVIYSFGYLCPSKLMTVVKCSVANTEKPGWNVMLIIITTRNEGRPAEYRWRPLFNAAKFG